MNPAADTGAGPGRILRRPFRAAAAGVLLAAAWVGVAAGAAGASASGGGVVAVSRPSVGKEGFLRTNLPGTLLAARPVEPRSAVLVRVAEARPHGTGVAYDLRYVGLEPGRHDLRRYLVRADGTSMDDVPPLSVEVVSVLPERHDGLLVAGGASAWPRLGGYRVVLVMVGTFWVLSLVPLLVAGRRREAAVVAPDPVEPTLAERLRPLVEAAAGGRLDTEGKARLERLLLEHWRRKLSLEGATLAESLARLREHPEGGALLRALERWLHQRPGAGATDVEALLAPYREGGGMKAGAGLRGPGRRPGNPEPS